jgi:valine--pyruvate aminotransferase
MTRYSKLGDQYARGSGILELMDDLGQALRQGDDLCMLGGGNPAAVPGLSEAFLELGRALTADAARWSRCIGDYTSPRGEPAFLEALAEQFRNRLGWSVGVENLVLTAGSQASFFALFNLLGGTDASGRLRPVVLPRVPEYVGYGNLGLGEAALRGLPACIETGTNPQRFRYAIDWAQLGETSDAAALCISTPGNPTGQLLGAHELGRLQSLARQFDVPLIVDAAYGAPFPGICFAADEALAWWQPDSVLCLSLSKLGLPGVRAGIIVAPADLAAAVMAFNASLTLAPVNLGPYLLQPWVESGELFEIGRRWLRPYYEARRDLALAALDTALTGAGIAYRVHEPGGGFFLWLWLPQLGLPVRELYVRLKQAGVLVVPGEHFCPGLAAPTSHVGQCLRLSYAGPPERFALGMQRMAAVLQALAPAPAIAAGQS